MQPEVSTIVERYAQCRLFFDASDHEINIEDNPFRRPTRTFDNEFINYEKPLTRGNQASNSALSTHRMLLNIYEADALFLPESGEGSFWDDFREFYSAENVARGEALRPILERKAFAFLDNEVELSGSWDSAKTVDFFRHFLGEELESRDESFERNPVFKAIADSPDPERCAKHYLIQMAPDFLSEASAMARMAPGAYGKIQSAIFNVLIDEYGASVHKNKHSTLYENTMRSVGLSPSVHYYWQFYHPTSLCLTNYFHYVAKNKRYSFRYIGALLRTEASLVNATKKQSALLRAVFGERVDTKYFDEHYHIDQHHGEMALNRVVIPALERFGDQIASEIVRGFLEFKLLEEIADEDMLAQFVFFNGLTENRAKSSKFYHTSVKGNEAVPLETFVECLGERSTTHTHPDHRLLVIESGTMDFWPIYGAPIALSEGDILSVPKHRLHGSIVTSDECVYHQPIAQLDDAALAGADQARAS